MSLGRGHRLLSPPLEIQPGLHIPSNSSNCEVFGEAQEVLKHSHGGNSILAAEALVHDAAATQHGRSNTSCSNPRPSGPGAVSAPSNEIVYIYE